MMNLWIQHLEIKKWRNQNDWTNIKFKCNLGEIRHFGVPDIIDYKWVHDSEI